MSADKMGIVATKPRHGPRRAPGRAAADVLRLAQGKGPVKGQQDLPRGGQWNCPVVANRIARWWPGVLPGGLGEWSHPLAGGGLGEADAVAGGEHDVGVVE